jgi:hypothetical protein
VAIVSDRPSHGVRLRLVLDKKKREYVGAVTTRDDAWDVRAVIDDADQVAVTTSAPAELAEYTRRVVRIAVRNAAADGAPIPRVIQRWRA